MNARVRAARWSRTSARCRPTTCRSSPLARTTSRRSRRSSRCPCRGRTPGAGMLERVGEGDRGIAARRGRRVHRVARRPEERMDGVPSVRPTAVRAARADPAAPHRDAVPPLRQLRRRRDARATPTRSRRAAFRICSSAARRFTAAKKSKRSAPRSRRSSGPTTSCRCLRRSRARCSRSTMSTCSSSGIGSARSIRSAIPKELGGNSGRSSR